MPDEPVPSTPTPEPAAATGDAGTAKVVYILYLVGIVVPLVAIVGVVMAYVKKGDAAGWLETHYRFQIRTFWIGFLYSLVGAFTSPFIIGWVILLFVLVWLIVRCVKGLNWVGNGQPVENVQTWMFP